MKKPIRTLYRNYSHNCCGVCKLHRVGVTVKQMHKKKCLEKECRHFRKFEEHPYWSQHKLKLQYQEKQKEERKLLRKIRKESQRNYFENLTKGQQE